MSRPWTRWAPRPLVFLRAGGLAGRHLRVCARRREIRRRTECNVPLMGARRRPSSYVRYFTVTGSTAELSNKPARHRGSDEAPPSIIQAGRDVLQRQPRLQPSQFKGAVPYGR